MPKTILDLCGGTGAWSLPYKKNMYNVINVTLPDYDVRYYTPPDNVYGILAAPPCTQFSIANRKKMNHDELMGGMEIVAACLKIIWECTARERLRFWCLENPRGRLRWFLGKPVLTFDPCDYGDLYTKKTDLWGFFNIPKKNPSTLLARNRIRDVVRTPKDRSITPSCFAYAFYKANR